MVAVARPVVARPLVVLLAKADATLALGRLGCFGKHGKLDVDWLRAKVTLNRLTWIRLFH